MEQKDKYKDPKWLLKASHSKHDIHSVRRGYVISIGTHEM